MGYSAEDYMVRADRFKPSGKWYDTFALNMSGCFEMSSVFDAVRSAMRLQGIELEKGWLLVVLEPYHKHSHPVIIKEN